VDNREYCTVNYPIFREMLTEFSEQLYAALEQDEAIEKKAIGRERLIEVLDEAKRAAKTYDAVRSLETLAPLKNFTYSDKTDSMIEKACFALEEFDCNQAVMIINEMEDII
jgi:hypothetical protein